MGRDTIERVNVGERTGFGDVLVSTFSLQWSTVTSSEIGPFNAPCSNLNIPTCAINPT